MKKKLILPFFIIPFTLSAQTGNFQVDGKLSKPENDQKAYLMYRKPDGLTIVDSIPLQSGTFKFSGHVEEPVKATISTGKTLRNAQMSGSKTIYIGLGHVNITGQSDLKTAQIAGGKINEENQKLEEVLGPIQQKMQDISRQFREIKEDQPNRDQLIQSLRDQNAQLSEAVKKEQEKFIIENPNSRISLELANSLIGYPADGESMMKHFNGLSKEIQNSPAGQRFAESIAKVQAVAIGMIAPDFTQNDPNGKPVSLKDFRGKYVLIDFWASWCGPCRVENPNLVKAYHTYKDQNFTVLGVSLDNPGKEDAWLKAVKDDELDWTQVSDLKGWNNEVAKQYYIRSIPQNLLIDPNGKIIAKNLRGEELAPALEKLLNK